MKSFQTKLQKYIEGLPAEARERTLQEIQPVLESGAASYKDWLDLISDPAADSNLRLTACSIISIIGDRRAFSALAQALQDENEKVRGYAAGGLAHLRLHARAGTYPEIVDLLINRIQNDSSVDVRLQAAFALREFRDPRSVAPLIAVITDQNQPAPVRDVAAEALAYIPDVRSIGVMIDALGDPEEVVRITAAYTLGSLAEVHAQGKLKGSNVSSELERALPHLLKALEDPSEKVRYWAVNALGSFGDQQTIAKLEHVAETDKGTWYGDEVAEAARYAIQNIRKSKRKQ